MSPVVRDLLARLGFSPPGNELDEAIRWALIELKLRREESAILKETLGCVLSSTAVLNHMDPEQIKECELATEA